MSEIENLKIYGGATYTVGNQDIIANEWEAGKTYVKGKSYVIREHRLYVCNVTHTSVEPFDATKWTEITIGDAIANNTTAIGSLSQLTTTDKSSLVGAVNEVNKYETDTYNVSTYGGTIICQKWGRVVNIQGANIGTVQSLPTGASHVLASIASKYCPANSLRVVGMANAGSYQATTNSQSYAISSDGRITTYAYASPSIANGVFNITYLV